MLGEMEGGIMIRLITGMVPAMLFGCALAALAPAALPQTAAALADPPSISGLVSPTHPVASAWYSDRNPVFSWRGAVATSAIAGYAYVLDQSPTTVPGTTVDLPPFSFAAKRVSSIGARPSALAVGDFNRDGKLDLAVLHAGSVTILFGKGNGSFGRRRSFAVPKDAISMAVADLNRDGRPDLVIGSYAGSDQPVTITVLLGNGNGTFEMGRHYSLGKATGAAWDVIPLAIADVNGDGRPDVVTSWGLRMFVLLGRGDGTLGPAHAFVADAHGANGDGAILSLALHDLNGDGRLDVVAGGLEGVNLPNGILSVLLGRGNGSFRAARTQSTGELLPFGLAVRDVNHDGKPDLLVADYADGADYGGPSYGAAVVFLGKGNGSFAQDVQYVVGPPGQYIPTALKVADFNRDGNADLLVSTRGGLYVLLGNGDGTVQGPVQFAGAVGAGPVAVGDFNRDGKPDVAAAGGAEGDKVSILLNRSTAAAYHGLADGVWYFHVRAVNTGAVGGPTATRAVRIDTQRPSTQAPSPAGVQSGGIAHLTYEVSDPPPCAGWCAVRIEVKNGHGAVLHTHTSGHAHSGVLYQASFRCRLPRGVYRFYVYATDAAGNKQSNVASNQLVVK
jgi:hypothetical protein